MRFLVIFCLFLMVGCASKKEATTTEKPIQDKLLFTLNNNTKVRFIGYTKFKMSKHQEPITVVNYHTKVADFPEKRKAEALALVNYLNEKAGPRFPRRMLVRAYQEETKNDSTYYKKTNTFVHKVMNEWKLMDSEAISRGY